MDPATTDLHRFSLEPITAAQDPRALSGLLEFRTGLPGPVVRRGVFLTPSAFGADEARWRLALTYGPGARATWGRGSTLDRRWLVSLYGRPSLFNRAWPAFGRTGGGLEILSRAAVPAPDASTSIGWPVRSAYRGDSYASWFLAASDGSAGLSGAAKALLPGVLGSLGLPMAWGRAVDAPAKADADAPTDRGDGDLPPATVLARLDERGLAVAWRLPGSAVRCCVSVAQTARGARYRMWAQAWRDEPGLRRLWPQVSAGNLPVPPDPAPVRALADLLKAGMEGIVRSSAPRRILHGDGAAALDDGFP